MRERAMKRGRRLAFVCTVTTAVLVTTGGLASIRLAAEGSPAQRLVEGPDGVQLTRENAIRLQNAVLPEAQEASIHLVLRNESAVRHEIGVGAYRGFFVAPSDADRAPLRRHAILHLHANLNAQVAVALRSIARGTLTSVGRVDHPRGTATGDPIGLHLVRSNLLPDMAYDVSATDLSGFSCSAMIECRVQPGFPRQGSVSPAEVWLAEQAVRKMIANWYGLEFTLDLGPPKDWIAVPRRLAFAGQPLDVPPLVERWPWQREARTHPVLKPASMDGAVLVAHPYLEAMGLAVTFGRWASWGEPPEPGARPLDPLWDWADGKPDLAAWLAAPKDITLARGNQRLTFLLDAPDATAADGTVVSLPAPARLLDGWPVVPL